MKRETGRPPAKVIASTHRPFPVAAKARNQDPVRQRHNALTRWAKRKPKRAPSLPKLPGWKPSSPPPPRRIRPLSTARPRSPGFGFAPRPRPGSRPQGPCKPPLGLRASPVPRVPGSAADRPQGSPNSARPLVFRSHPLVVYRTAPSRVRAQPRRRPQPAPGGLARSRIGRGSAARIAKFGLGCVFPRARLAR